mgnify:CR=1 FL=1
MNIKQSEKGKKFNMENQEINRYDKNNDKIIILIASYCDDEILNTTYCHVCNVLRNMI